jgi:hypothetical protein
VLGEVVGIHIAETLLEEGIYQTAKAQPILRAGGPTAYYGISDEHRFDMVRPGRVSNRLYQSRIVFRSYPDVAAGQMTPQKAVVNGVCFQRNLHLGEIRRIAVAGQLKGFDVLFAPAFGNGVVKIARLTALP